MLANVDATENEIYKFIEKAPQIKSIKDGQSYISSLRISLKYFVMQQQLKEKKYKDMQIEFEQVSENEKVLRIENVAKSAVFDWIHLYVVNGSKMSMPRPFINPEQRKKLDIMKEAKLFGPYINFLNSQDINEKIKTELNMGKVFSIVVFNLS